VRFISCFPCFAMDSDVWHISIVEMQVFIVALLSNFELSVPEDSNIVRSRAFVMVPFVEGQINRGPQLPVTISRISK